MDLIDQAYPNPNTDNTDLLLVEKIQSLVKYRAHSQHS